MNNHSNLAAPVGDDSGLRTRSAMLDAAERLFSERGVDGVSVRDITAAAGVNLGAANYHFRSKEGLVIEVFGRRLKPMNRARIARLDALEEAAGKRPVDLSQIVEALVRPSLEIEPDLPNCDGAVLRLLSRCFAELNPKLKKFVDEQFAEVAGRFDAAFLRAIPGLSPAELLWRMSFFVGALHQGQDVWLRFQRSSRQAVNAAVARPDREEFIRQITAFVSAGMRAPSPEKPRKVSRRAPARRSLGKLTRRKP